MKKAILHRKNSLFYKNRNGAQMGELFMSLIHTCELNHVNPFDYLNELQRARRGVEANAVGVAALELSRDAGRDRQLVAPQAVPHPGSSPVSGSAIASPADPSAYLSCARSTRGNREPRRPPDRRAAVSAVATHAYRKDTINHYWQ